MVATVESGLLSLVWSRRRRKGIEWRIEAVRRALEGPPKFPPGVEDALEDLTEKQREVAVLIYGYALSQREAAVILEISRGALRDRLGSLNIKLGRRGLRTTEGHGRSNSELRRVLGEQDPWLDQYIAQLRRQGILGAG